MEVFSPTSSMQANQLDAVGSLSGQVGPNLGQTSSFYYEAESIILNY